MLLRRGGITISLFSNSTAVVGWCRTRRGQRRRKGSSIRLGSKRRGFCLGSRQVVHWRVVLSPFRALHKLIMEMATNGRLVEGYHWSLPFLRPQIFPLC
ncbi:unnamed protein product [Coffea canephora]|uniref:Uncharacterized protein n=1 Tax=Coffea canephora TaxID=49390 RepID=A0A068U6K8_COFCA|nr:unnamed protein product [Coffea canephora]